MWYKSNTSQTTEFKDDTYKLLNTTFFLRKQYNKAFYR